MYLDELHSFPRRVKTNFTILKVSPWRDSGLQACEATPFDRGTGWWKADRLQIGPVIWGRKVIEKK
jgi:hypothetical protein